MKTSFFKDASAAYQYASQIYDSSTEFLRENFKKFINGKLKNRCRAYYPYVRIQVETLRNVDTRPSYGFVEQPGDYQTTLTRPKLFQRYLIEQFNQLLHHHRGPLEIGVSDIPIPIHFAFPDGMHVEADLSPATLIYWRDYFDLPDLSVMDDTIVNGSIYLNHHNIKPLALFSAPRIDYSLFRLKHYTATSCEHFQNFVLFTNYQFYIDEFIDYAKKLIKSDQKKYTAFIQPGDQILTNKSTAKKQSPIHELKHLPQMPSYHLKRKDNNGITLVNIGIGPSNAKTITDHIAVLRPHAWIMLGHCAGLRNSQQLGDYVLAHAYVRDDHVLDADLPLWVPVPALAEIQIALQKAVGEVTGFDGYELKKIMRTGTVATIDNRNWELRDQGELLQRFNQSRAIALDMESATLAANGFRFRVPYGTLLCVSDRPLHGEIKLPGMANAFYYKQVFQHLQIGIRTMELLAELRIESLHSRKLRSFSEVAFQ
ncbi:MAG: AMP nucleosidase [Alphaproteobacteria bacterium]|nr:AMP nucleosidase [Alphaproteobacteria bacterium]